MKKWQKVTLCVIGGIVAAIVLFFLFIGGCVDFVFNVWSGEAGK